MGGRRSGGGRQLAERFQIAEILAAAGSALVLDQGYATQAVSKSFTPLIVVIRSMRFGGRPT